MIKFLLITQYVIEMSFKKQQQQKYEELRNLFKVRILFSLPSSLYYITTTHVRTIHCTLFTGELHHGENISIFTTTTTTICTTTATTTIHFVVAISHGTSFLSICIFILFMFLFECFHVGTFVGYSISCIVATVLQSVVEFSLCSLAS